MRREAPAAARNREPIAEALAEELPSAGLVLEVASGTGEHAVHLARRFPHLQWQPSDPDPAALESIAAWREHEALANLLPPLEIDAAGAGWPIAAADAVLCINMVHISPLAATEGVLRQGAGLLPAGAPLIFYGPYIEDGVETAPSNLAFDAWLKARDPQFGLRTLGWLDEMALGHDFERTRRIPMPANNLTLVYRKRP